MVPDLVDPDALVWIHLQHPSDKISCQRVDTLGDGVYARLVGKDVPSILR